MTDNIERAINILEKLRGTDCGDENCIREAELALAITLLRSAASRESAWRPIDDKAKDGNEVALYWNYFYDGDKAPTHGITIGFWNGKMFECDDEETPNCITHYASLPPPPDMGGEG